MPSRTNKIMLICSILALVLISTLRVEAQQKKGTLVFRGYTQNVKWSLDSKYLVFSDGSDPSLSTLRGPWYAYAVDSQTLTTSNLWPLQPQLTPAEIQAFKLTTPDSYMYLSPDGRYVLFSGQAVATSPGEGYYIPLLVGERATLRVVDTKNVSFETERGSDWFDVIWGGTDENPVFVTQLTDPNTNVIPGGYTSGQGSLLNNPITDYGSLRRPIIGTQSYRSYTVLDLSHDGTKVLVYAVKTFPNKAARIEDERLLVIDVDSPANTIELPILPSGTDGLNYDVAMATFADMGNTHILLILKTGLYIFNTERNTMTFADDRLTTNDIRNQFNFRLSSAMLSPDKAWIAFKYNGDLRVLDLRPSVLKLTPSATDTPSPAP